VSGILPGMEERDRRALDWAARHGGVVTRDMLQNWGFTQNQIKGRVRRRGWESLGRGAYRIIPPRDHRDLLVAAVTIHENAVVSHESAAEIHGFSRVANGRVVVTMHTRTTHDFAGVTAHRTHDLLDDHVIEIAGLRVTTPERTVVDLAATRRPWLMSAIVDDLVARGLADLDTLTAVVDSVARRGKPGITTMREVLEPRVGAPRRQSELERKARELLTDAGLPEPISEYPIPWAPGRRFDDAYPDRQLALEWDGRRYHGQLEAFDVDRARDREATVHGWRVLRFTWADVAERPQMVADTIRRLITPFGRTVG
jgi:hypothetical protein